MNTMLTHLDLFSGIGGFALAARWTRSIRTVAFCEVDEYCVKVLNKNFTGVPVYGDITKEREWPQADIVTGGFPCQPFSGIGSQRGKDDERYLWPAMLSVINAVRPTWVVGENVAGIKKLALDTILTDMDALGYNCQALNIPAAGVGVPHERQRLWFVAHAKSGQSWEQAQWERRQGVDGRSDDCRGVEGTRQKVGAAIGCGPKPRLGRGVDGIPCWVDGDWELGLRRVTKNSTNRANRLHAIGNAIVPQVAYQILKGIVEIEGVV